MPKKKIKQKYFSYVFICYKITNAFFRKLTNKNDVIISAANYLYFAKSAPLFVDKRKFNENVVYGKNFLKIMVEETKDNSNSFLLHKRRDNEYNCKKDSRR